MGEWINKQWYISYNGVLLRDRKESLIHTMTWMNLEFMSGKGQTQG